MPSRSAARPRQTESSDRQLVKFDAKARAEELQVAIDTRRPQLTALLGGDARLTERFITVALDAIVRDRNLLSADPLSLIASIRTSAMMGLEPSGVLGDGAIVVYKEEGVGIAQFQPMYRGLMKLARNGDVMAIDAARHYENDEFDYQRGTDPKIVHRPKLGGDRGAVVGAYAYAKLRSGELIVRYKTIAEIHAIRDRHSRQWKKSGASSIWGQNPESMELKTMVRDLAKFLPLTAKAAEVLAYDDRADAIRVETMRQRDDLAAIVPGSRTRARFVDDTAEPAENGSGPTEEGPSAPEGETVDGEAVEASEPGAGACGARPPKDGLLDDAGPCIADAGHDGQSVHVNTEGDSWPS